MAAHRCLLAHADGRVERVWWEHRNVAAHLGGSVTFVGAVGADVVAVARADAPATATPNALFRTHRSAFFDDADAPRGAVVFVGDADGAAADVDEACLSVLGIAAGDDARGDDARRDAA